MSDRYIDRISMDWPKELRNQYLPKEAKIQPSIAKEAKENMLLSESPEDLFVEAALTGNLKRLLEFTSTMAINSRNRKSQTPLIAASIGGHSNAIFFLLSKGANVSLVDCTGNTALHHATLREHLNVIDKLLLKTNINLENERHQTILHVAVEEAKFKVLDHILKIPNLNVDAQDFNGNTAIHLAIKTGNLKILCQLLTMPVDLSLYNTDGMNALNVSVRKDGLEFLRALLQSKTGMDILPRKTTYGESNLEIAIRERNSEILTYLLQPNMHPENLISSEIDKKYGATALLWAVLVLDIDLIDKILRIKPMLLNVKDKFGKTPLDHLCCMHEIENVTKEKLVNVAIKLICEGADMNMIDNKNGLYKLIKDIFIVRFKF